jgi:DNA-binding NarL/FixJ family response regulator
MSPSVLRTVIVDSDPQARAAIRQTVAAVPSLAIVGECADVAEAAVKAPSLRPDVMIVEVPIDPAQGDAGAAGAPAP